MYLNSVQIIGFIGKDPERRQARDNGAAFTVLNRHSAVMEERGRVGLEDRMASRRRYMELTARATDCSSCRQHHVFVDVPAYAAIPITYTAFADWLKAHPNIQALYSKAYKAMQKS